MAKSNLTTKIEPGEGIVVDKVTISMSRYKELLDAERELGRLRAHGVDNWEGYERWPEDDDELEDL